MRATLRVFHAFSLTAALLAGCGNPKDDVPPSPPDLATAPDLGIAARKDIVDTAIGAGQFTTLVAAVQGAGLEQTLRGTGPFTVFAPTDAAFQKLPSFLLTKLVTQPYKTELGLILKYHVLAGQVKAADVLGKKQDVTTVAAAPLNVDGNGGKVVLNGSINVTKADVLAKNGVIHVIDGVLLPTLVDTAVGYDDGPVKFSTLVAAIKAAGLVDTLNGAGPFTVFAPTDAAFAALKASLGDAAFNALLANKAKLTRVLTYHVLAGAVYQKDVASGAVTTVETNKLTLAVAAGKVTIADSTASAANVVFTDVPGRNGVIHVIDKVLIPPGL